MKLETLYPLGGDPLAALSHAGSTVEGLPKIATALASMIVSETLGLQLHDLRLAASLILFAIPFGMGRRLSAVTSVAKRGAARR